MTLVEILKAVELNGDGEFSLPGAMTVEEAEAAILALVPEKIKIHPNMTDDEYREASARNSAIDAVLDAFNKKA